MVVKLAGASVSLFQFSEPVPRMLRLNVWSSCLYSIGSSFASQQWCCLFRNSRCVIRPDKNVDTTVSFVYIISSPAIRRCIPPPVAQQPLVGQGLLIIEVSRSHSFRHTILGTLLLTSDLPNSETSTCKHTTLIRDRHPCSGGIRTRKPSKQAAADSALRRTAIEIGLVPAYLKAIYAAGGRHQKTKSALTYDHCLCQLTCECVIRRDFRIPPVCK